MDIDVIVIAAAGSVMQHFQLGYIVRCLLVVLQKISNDMLSPIPNTLGFHLSAYRVSGAQRTFTVARVKWFSVWIPDHRVASPGHATRVEILKLGQKTLPQNAMSAQLEPELALERLPPVERSE